MRWIIGTVAGFIVGGLLGFGFAAWLIGEDMRDHQYERFPH